MNADRQNVLRELSIDELLLVAGGDDHYYAGDSHPPQDWPPPPVFVDPWGPGSGGDPGGSSPPPPPPEHTLSDHIDCAAKHISDAIAQKADHHYMEWEGFVWMDHNGVVHASDIAPHGQSGSIYVDPQSVGVPADGYIIAIVHNHPDQVLQDPNTGATEPSADPTRAAEPSNGDMDILNGMYQNLHQYEGNPAYGAYPGGFSASDVRMYVAYDGSLSEYKWTDQDWSNHPGHEPGQADWAKKATDFNPACEN